EVTDLLVHHLSHQRVPTGLAAVAGFENVVFFPIRFRAESLPRRRVERWPVNTPAAVRQVLKIQLAVVGIHRRLQRTDRVEALHDLIAVGPGSRRVSEANASGISAFQKLALLTNLSLRRVRSSAVGRRRHAQKAIPRLIAVFEKRDTFFFPRCPRHAGPACFSANDPAVLLQLLLVRVAEVVEKYLFLRLRGRPSEK